MHIYINIFVCYIFTQMHSYTHAYIYLYVSIRLWIYTSSIFIERHAYTPAYKCACIQKLWTYMYICCYISGYDAVHIHKMAYIDIYIHIRLPYIYTTICVYIYSVYIDLGTCRHRCIWTYIYTYI